MYWSRNDLWMKWMNDALYYCCKPKALYNHVCVCVGGGGHLDDATAATWQPCQCAHHTNYRWRGERIIVMNILLNKYFCCTVFKKIQTFILTGCREYLYISVCIWYEIVLHKWNGETLIKWLSEQFWIEMHRLTGQWSESSDFAHVRPGSVTGPVSLTSCRFQKNKIKEIYKYDLGKQH